LNAKLIQSNDGFSLNNLYELRYFTDLVNTHSDSAIIGDEDWQSGISNLSSLFQYSSKRDLALSVIRQFESINPLRKYKSDWKVFLSESKIEDFVEVDSEIIYVSTIHKAKGKEFNNVFLLLKNFDAVPDDNKRQLYVAITRAKTNLSIHYNSEFLRTIDTKGLSYKIDSQKYNEPKQIGLYLTHRDVQLGYFEFVQQRIENLQSGSNLTVIEDGLANARGELIIKYSKAFKDSLIERQNKGYRLAAAKVNFIVYWKDEDKGKEVKIILPKMLLSFKPLG
ncbi:MAG TPA: ATP-binding domain-containing protein, partial [Puia sp.]